MAISAELYEQIIKCNKCGFCQATCRAYKEVLDESYCARGRVRLIKAVMDGQLEISEKYAEIIESCIQCLECAFTCPSGVGPDKIILAARQELVRRRGLPLPKRIALRHLFPHKGRLRVAFKGLRLAQKYLLNWLPGFTGFRGVDVRRFPVGDHPLEIQVPARIPVEKPGYRVAFFYGCMINNTLPEVGQAVIRVLKRNDIEVLIPQEQVCCGTPMYVAGEVETARRLARQNLRVFGDLDVDAIITACGSCGTALKKEYPELLRNETEGAQRIKDFSSKIYDISEFLVDRVGLDGAPMGPVQKVVTYHDPCHLNRGQGVSRQPRSILRSIPGLVLVEMAEADRCCGGAGLHQVAFPEISIPTSQRKAGNIARTGAQAVVTGCPACIQRIQGTINLSGMKQKVLHPIQLLDEAYAAAGPEEQAPALEQAI